MDEDQKVYYVRFSRRTRGMSYCASCMLVPGLTVLVMLILNISALLTIIALGPDKFESNILKIEYLPLELTITLILSIIIVVLFFSPSKIDKFIDWWYGL